MCGFLCSFGVDAVHREQLVRSLESMESRGPDGEGVVFSDRVFLGHKRLAIQDLDDRALQPMSSHCGRYKIVFNGEIYNFQKLRKELKISGVDLRTKSDTEVLIELYCLHGPKFLSKLEGMFAFVIWDTQNGVGFCARDPYGIKPVYYSLDSKFGFLISSQVKAISHLTGEQGVSEFSRRAFRALGSIPDPYTYLENVYAVNAGTAFSFNSSGVIESWVYCSIGDAWAVEFSGETEETKLANIVRESIRKSVQKHLVSDVPVGIFLSGGIDSSVVAAVVRELKPDERIVGITIAFDEFKGTGQSEVEGAAAVARQYDLEHYVRYVGVEEFLADFPLILKSMDQPSIDGINTWYAAKAAAENDLKVVLSGVGGDELFFGYSNYTRVAKWLRRWKVVSSMGFAPRILKGLSNVTSKHLGLRHKSVDLPYLLGDVHQGWFLGRSAACIADFLPDVDTGPRIAALNSFFAKIGLRSKARSVKLAMADLDSRFYLKNQLLRDADWSTMAHSVELRTPLVDAALLSDLSPYLYSMQRFSGKSLLASVPEKQLPVEVTDRAKSGFGIPVERWLLVDSKSSNERSSRSILSKRVESVFFENLSEV